MSRKKTLERERKKEKKREESNRIMTTDRTDKKFIIY